MVTIFRNDCLYLIEGEIGLLNNCERIVEGKSRGSSGTFAENEEYGRHVIVDRQD